MAWAPPMRPPFLRFSRVSSPPNTWVRGRVVLDQRDDLVGRGAALGGLGGDLHQGAEPGGDRLRVDDADVDLALEGPGAVLGRGHGGRQGRGDVDAHDRVAVGAGRAGRPPRRRRATGAAVSGRPSKAAIFR